MMILRGTEENQKAELSLSTPYPLRVIDSFFDKPSYISLKHELPDLPHFDNQVRMHGDISKGDPSYEDLISKSVNWKRLHQWIFSKDFPSYMFSLFSKDLDEYLRRGEMVIDPRKIPFSELFSEGRNGELSEVAPEEAVLYSRLDIGYGLEGYGKVNGGKGIHVDNWPRIFSGLVYFSDASDFVGGDFEIYQMKKGLGFLGPRLQLSRLTSIPVRENRAIISLQCNHAFHSVREVTKVFKPRFAAYFALSCSTDVWCSFKSKKEAKLTVSRISRFKPN